MENRYQVFEQGRFVIIEGNLGQDPELFFKETSTRATLSIATKAGSTKDESGSYKDVTDWYKFSIFDNGGASSAFINFLQNPPSEKLALKKGNRVRLYAFIKKGKSIERDGNIYVNEDIVEFLALKRVITGTSQNNDSTDTLEPVTAQAPKATGADDIPF